MRDAFTTRQISRVVSHSRANIGIPVVSELPHLLACAQIPVTAIASAHMSYHEVVTGDPSMSTVKATLLSSIDLI